MIDSMAMPYFNFAQLSAHKHSVDEDVRVHTLRPRLTGGCRALFVRGSRATPRLPQGMGS